MVNPSLLHRGSQGSPQLHVALGVQAPCMAGEPLHSLGSAALSSPVCFAAALCSHHTSPGKAKIISNPRPLYRTLCPEIFMWLVLLSALLHFTSQLAFSGLWRRCPLQWYSLSNPLSFHSLRWSTLLICSRVYCRGHTDYKLSKSKTRPTVFTTLKLAPRKVPSP